MVPARTLARGDSPGVAPPLAAPNGALASDTNGQSLLCSPMPGEPHTPRSGPLAMNANAAPTRRAGTTPPLAGALVRLRRGTQSGGEWRASGARRQNKTPTACQETRPATDGARPQGEPATRGAANSSR